MTAETPDAITGQAGTLDRVLTGVPVNDQREPAKVPGNPYLFAHDCLDALVRRYQEAGYQIPDLRIDAYNVDALVAAATIMLDAFGVSVATEDGRYGHLTVAPRNED